MSPDFLNLQGLERSNLVQKRARLGSSRFVWFKRVHQVNLGSKGFIRVWGVSSFPGLVNFYLELFFLSFINQIFNFQIINDVLKLEGYKIPQVENFEPSGPLETSSTLNHQVSYTDNHNDDYDTFYNLNNSQFNDDSIRVIGYGDDSIRVIGYNDEDQQFDETDDDLSEEDEDQYENEDEDFLYAIALSRMTIVKPSAPLEETVENKFDYRVNPVASAPKFDSELYETGTSSAPKTGQSEYFNKFMNYVKI